MSKSIIWSGLLASLLLVSCNKGNNNQQQAPSALPFPVIEVPIKSITGYDTYPANIEGTTNSDVRAKVSGYITKVLVEDRKSTRLNSSHVRISYAVFCLK